jgi:hypothetical protein
MKIDGGCHCGDVAYEAEINPSNVTICHCTDCQRMSGTPFRTVVPTRAEDFKLTRGELKIYIKRAESGAERPQAFCARCGTHIYATGVGDAAAVLGLRAGTSAQADALVPKREVWRRSALHWVGDLGVEHSKETA